MKADNFQQKIGETAACMNRLMMTTKWCVQLTSNDTYFTDSWFSGVRTGQEVMDERVEYCGTLKTSRKGFCLATLENLMKDCPGGSYLILEINPRVSADIPIMDIGYK